MPFLFFILLFSFRSFAQHSSQPEKESVSDLRSGIEMFRIEDIEDEKEVWLERTSNLSYFLRIKTEDHEEKIQKITSKDARKLEMDFASRFLKCQLELPPSQEGCKVSLKLSMKGEGHDVCRKDDKKTQEIVPFLKELEKRF